MFGACSAELFLRNHLDSAGRQVMRPMSSADSTCEAAVHSWHSSTANDHPSVLTALKIIVGKLVGAETVQHAKEVVCEPT